MLWNITMENMYMYVSPLIEGKNHDNGGNFNDRIGSINIPAEGRSSTCKFLSTSCQRGKLITRATTQVMY